MAKARRIWNYLHPTERAMLQTPAQPCALPDLGSRENQRLIDDMFLTMRRANGVGLAAPQVGVALRLAVVLRLDAPDQDPYVLVNPVLDELSAQDEDDEEGCLSIPGVYGIVPRHIRLRLRAFDRRGQPFTAMADHLLARVIQHEVDHLNGRLFIDRATSFTRGESLLPS